MERFDRIFRLHAVLQGARYPVSRARLEDELECSRATLYRTIRDMRLYFGAPIAHDRERGGYFYDHEAPDGHPYELPGLWFNASELYALLAAQRLLAAVDPGILQAHITPLLDRIEAILSNKHLGSGELLDRVHILSVAARTATPVQFTTATRALTERRRLTIEYHGRERDVLTRRTVSPQRLVHHRGNWYLDAWCHSAEALRSFSIDRIGRAAQLDDRALSLGNDELDAHFGTTYGIFAGPATHAAVLRFTAERARWVADENWHRDQTGRFLEDGSFELSVPYGDPRELLMDTLKYGPDVEVVAPESLRRMARERLAAALGRYEGK